ncbi:MAG: hypothetical protein EOM28_03215 [Clostridia bacterium]|nr:hypothetical protein [Clostridia bacterium]
MSEEIKWGGNWRIPSSELKYGGELLVDSKQGTIRLIVFYACDFDDIYVEKLFPDEMPIIYGEISNGTKVTLSNCKVVNRHTQNFQLDTITIFAEYMFVGAEYTQDQLSFNGYSYVFSNIIEWSGLCYFDSCLDQPISYKWEIKEDVTVQCREGLSITFTPEMGALPLRCTKSELKLYQNVNVKFEYEKPVLISESLEDVKSLIHLIDIGIEDNIYIEKIKCFSNNFKEEDGQYIPISAYINQPQESLYSPEAYYNLFTLPMLTEENRLFEKWFAIYGKLKPIVDLYSSVFSYPKMPIEMVFLNAVQALETYHARFVCDKLKDYKEKAQLLIDGRPETERELHKMQFLSTTQIDENIKYIILKSRLCDLFICNFQFEFCNFYEERFPYKLIDSIVDTRHYFTHYSSAKEQKALSGKNLNYGIRIMRLVLEFYILNEIGFSIDHIRKVIGRRQTTITMEMKRDKEMFEMKDSQ